jgi:protein involved in polysaccharide export with SLBB domain
MSPRQAGWRGGAIVMRWAGSAVAAVILVLAPGSALAAPPAQPSGYTIGPDDVLDVTVWNNAGLSRTVPVRPDGKISLPLVDDVQATGLTPRQLKGDLTRRLAKYIASPEVSVIVSRLPVLVTIPHIGAVGTSRHRLWLTAAPIAIGIVLVVLVSYHIASGNDQLAALFSRGAP